MIKKIVKLFIVLLMLMIISFENVFAMSFTYIDDTEANNLQEQHIFFVNQFQINEGVMEIEGYSYISHRDNLGYDPATGKGNLRTYIVAYKDTDGNPDTDDWSSEYRWGKCANNNNEDTEKSENCYIKRMSLDVDVDMSYNRCTSGESDKNSDDGCAIIDEVLEKAENGTYNYLNNTCTVSSGSYTVGNYAACLYENVGFTGRIDLNNIYDVFGDADNIRFRIMSYIGTKHLSSDDARINYYASPLAVYPGDGVCSIDGVACVQDRETVSGIFKFVLGGLNEWVYFDAQSAIGREYDGDSFSNTKFAYTGYNGTGRYRVLGFGSKFSKSKISSVGSTVYGRYTDRTIRLDSIYNNTRFSGTSYNIVPANDGISCAYTNISECKKDYYTGVGNVVLDGNFKMSLEKLIEKITCDDVADINGDGKYTNADEIKEIDDLRCSSNKDEATVKLHQCIGDKEEEKIVITGEMYYKDSSFSSIPEACKQSYYTKINDDYYLPIEVTAEVLIEQTGIFTFANFSNNRIYAGKGFRINNIEVVNGDSDRDKLNESLDAGIVYKSSIKWTVANKLIRTKEPYYSYSAIKYVGKQGGGCEVDEDFDIYELLAKPEIQTNKDNELLHYYNANGNLIDGNIRGASMGAISYELRGSSEKNDPYFYNTDRNDSNDVDDKFKFKSCDSNSASSRCEESVKGSWKEVYHWDDADILDEIKNVVLRDTTKFDINFAYGVYYDRTYIYDLPYAYVALSDIRYDDKNYKAGDVIYSTNRIHALSDNNLFYAGNKYFVGFKYIYRYANPEFDFPFNLEENDVSLVKGMDWTLSGRCGVNLNDGYYTENTTIPGKVRLLYKYRSISTNNAFPKVNGNYNNISAVNWKNWYLNSDGTVNSNNVNRIINSYNNNKLDYSVTFAKNSSSNFDISDIATCGSANKCSSSYGSLNHLLVTGESEFINNYTASQYGFTKKPSSTDRKYCGLGLFSETCNVFN